MSEEKNPKEILKILKYSKYIYDVDEVCKIFEIEKTDFLRWKRKYEGKEDLSLYNS